MIYPGKEELTDEQCIELYRQGEKTMSDVLLDRYKNLVRSKASTLFILGGDRDDLIQEGMIGLYNAIRDYDFGRDASFYTFADLCIDRQIFKAIQSSGRNKNRPLNEYISFYAEHGNDEDNNMTLADSLYANTNEEPEMKIIDEEAVNEIAELIENNLTDRERDVLKLNIAGIPTSRIAAILGIDGKSADNALQRAKGKLKKEIRI